LSALRPHPNKYFTFAVVIELLAALAALVPIALVAVTVNV
jgi:hypothetical protein